MCLSCQSNTLLGQDKAEAERDREATQDKYRAMSQERGHLKEQVRQLESKAEELYYAIREAKSLEKQLEQQANQLEVDGPEKDLHHYSIKVSPLGSHRVGLVR